MAFSQGSRSGLSYVVENSFGSTPSSPSMISLPFSTHSIGLTKERVQGNDIQPDRMQRVDRQGNKSISGDIVADLRAGDFDDLIESAFFSSFDSSGVIEIGTTPKYLTIEDRALDIDQYRQFTGCAVSTMSMSIAPNQMVTTTFSVVGKDMEQSSTSLDPSPTPSSTNEPFDIYTGEIKVGGSTVAIVTSLELSLSNSLAPTFVVGSDATPQIEYGRANVEGTLTAYYEDASIVNLFTNETTSSVEVELSDVGAANTYTFFIPRVKFNGADVPVSGEGSRTISLPFVGLYSSAEGTNFRLTKS